MALWSNSSHNLANLIGRSGDRASPPTSKREREKNSKREEKNRIWKRRLDHKLLSVNKRLDSKDVNYGLNDQYDA